MMASGEDPGRKLTSPNYTSNGGARLDPCYFVAHILESANEVTAENRAITKGIGIKGLD